MKQFWSEKAKKLTPYVAGEQPKLKNLIKLNTNENPYPPSPAALQALREFDGEKLSLYPRTDGGEFRQAVARVNGVDVKNVFCANGSDEVLAFAFQAFFDDDVRTPAVGYSFYPVWAELFDIKLKYVDMSENFSVNVQGFDGKGAVIAHPNAPTGISLTIGEIERILQQTSGVVIMDEAYIDFGAQSSLSLLDDYKNLVVVRTLSKGYSLAGLRMGYALAHEDLITALECVKDSFNSYPTDMLAQRIGAQAILDEKYHNETSKRVIATRVRTEIGLKKMGFSVLPSGANFLFATHPNVHARDIFAKLREKGIVVRHFEKAGIENHLRITVGTDAQMDAFLSAVLEIVS